MTLEELIEAGYSAGKAAETLGVTRNTAIGRAWRLGLHFHGDGKDAVRKERANQYTLRKQRQAKEAERSRERRQREREEYEQARDEKRARLKAQFHKPGRIVALCGWGS